VASTVYLFRPRRSLLERAARIMADMGWRGPAGGAGERPWVIGVHVRHGRLQASRGEGVP
jgi:hypothetical protein